jgi:hypothetical protein
MFDRVGSLAERVATNVSRRAFLGRMGQGALGLAAVIGGVLALPSQARAGAAWCLISFVGGSPHPGCQIYKAIKGTCPCGGTLVSYKPGCATRNC